MAEKYGLTEAGFRLKRLREIIDDIKAKMLFVDDPKTGQKLQLDFDENDPFIQFINLVADQLATIWELLNGAYDQFDPLKATGPMLSALVQLNGITRKRGNPSSIIVNFYGERGLMIPVGTRVTDSKQILIWKVIGDDNDPQSVVDRTINTFDGSTNTYYAAIECKTVNNGAFQVEERDINTILDPIPGLNSVINLALATPGEPDETDIALRRRREKSTETPSQGMAESMCCALLGLENVLYCKIFTNRSMKVDKEKGIPAKSIAIVVQVSDNYKSDESIKKKIATKIFLTSGLGEEFYNLDDRDIPDKEDVCQSDEIRDSFNQATIVKFIYPREIPIYVKAVVTDMEGSSKPDNFITQIKNNIIQFSKYGVQGLGIENQGTIFDSFGFPPSENIDLSRLYTPVNAVPGIKILSLQIGLERGVYSSQDIDIDWWQVGKFIPENIDVDYIETQYQ